MYRKKLVIKRVTTGKNISAMITRRPGVDRIIPYLLSEILMFSVSSFQSFLNFPEASDHMIKRK